MIRNFIILFFASIVLYACEDIRSYPPEPEIEYSYHFLSDTSDLLGNKAKKLYLEFKFADGDGDLPNPFQNDTFLRGKIFFNFYEKKNGIYTLYPISNFPDSLKPIFQIPFDNILTREGQNKTLTGKIKIDYFFYNYPPIITYPFDTFKLEFYIIDMAYHSSNIVTVPEEMVLGN